MATSERFVQNHLRALPLFERLSPDQLAVVARSFQVLRYEPGQLVFQQGQPTQGMFVFVSGRGILTRRGANGFEEQIGQVTGGQYLNEMALYRPGIETASLRVVETMIVLFLSRAAMMQLIAHRPEIRTNLRVLHGPHDAQAGRQAPRKLFRGQRDDEMVLHIFRHHWWMFVRRVWLPIILVIIAIIAFALLNVSAPLLALAVGGFGVVLAGLFSFYLYFEWRNDSVIITDQRVVRIWIDMLRFENTLTEIPLDRILEANVVVPPLDPFARLFNYANLFLKTAGDAANLNLPFMTNAHRIQSLIFEERARYQQQSVERSRDSIRAEIEQALGIQPVAQTGGQRRTANAEAQIDQNVGPFFARTRFIDQQGQLTYRKHWTIWFGRIFPPLLVIFAALVVGLLALLPDFPLAGAIGLSVAAFIFILGAMWLYLADWDWRNDMLQINDETITIIHRRPFWLQNQVDRVRLDQVDNVMAEISGLLDNLLNRGTIRISLVGSNERKQFRNIYDPQGVQADISRRQAHFRALQREGQINQQRQAITDYLSVYHQTIAAGAAPFNAGYDPSLPVNLNSAAPRPAQPQTATGLHFDPTATRRGVQPDPSEARPAPPAFPTQPASTPEAPPPPPPSDAVRPPRVPRSRPNFLPE